MMTREQMIETIAHELTRQADKSGAFGLWFDPKYTSGPAGAKIDGYLDLGALADAVGVGAGICTAHQSAQGEPWEITWGE